MNTQSVSQTFPRPWTLSAAGLAMILAFGVMTNPLPNPGQLPAFGFGSIERTRDDNEIPPTADKDQYAPDAVLAAFKEGVPYEVCMMSAKAHGLKFDPHVRSPYFVRFLIPSARIKAGETPDSIIAELQQDPIFKYVEHDYVITQDQALPNDPNLNLEWWAHNTGQTGGTPDADIDGPEGWLTIGAGPKIKVAVCDDSFQLNHPDLVNVYWTNTAEIAGNGIDDDANGFIDDIHGWDFYQDDNDPSPDASGYHGIHVSGILGMQHNNGIGGAGTAPRVDIIPVRMYSSAGNPQYISDLAQAVDYGWRNGAKVISVSYNIDTYNTTLLDAIRRADTADCVYCNSSGNNGQNIDTLRGAIANLTQNSIFVAATDQLDHVASFSNYGQTVKTAAPGVHIWSTYRNSTYEYLDGTSMSTPCAAGVIAMERLMNPELTDTQAITRVRLTGDFIPALAGITDASRVNLVRTIESDTTPPSDPTGLKVCDAGSSAMKVMFNAAGDDGAVGSAAAYDVRISTSPITLANFGSAVAVPNTLGGAPVGTPLTCPIKGLKPGASYYIAVKSFDNLFNASTGMASFGPFQMNAPVLFDGFESGGWTATGSWQIITGDPYSGTMSLSDSPSGNYANNTAAAVTRTAAVTVPAESIVQVKAKIDLEANADYVWLDASGNGGSTWTHVVRLTGLNSSWQTYRSSLYRFGGLSTKFRFVIVTDGVSTRQGVTIDDFEIIKGRLIDRDDCSNTANFTPTGTWARTNERVLSPTYSWTDSPSTPYANSSDSWIHGNRSIDISGTVNPMFAYALYSNTESGDYYSPQVSADGGAWMNLSQASGIDTAWPNYGISLPTANSVQLGFRLTSNASANNVGVHVDDISVVDEELQGIFGGTIDRDGYSGNGRQISAQVYMGGILKGTFPVTVNAGAYSMNIPLTGNADIVFTGPQFLVRRYNGITLSACTPALNVSMVNGDADNNNEIGLSDYGILSAAYGSEIGDPGYSAAADFDGNGEVGLSDYGILSSNYGEAGD